MSCSRQEMLLTVWHCRGLLQESHISCVRFLLTGLYQARRRNRGKGNLQRYSQSLPEICIRHGRDRSFERQTLHAKKQNT